MRQLPTPQQVLKNLHEDSLFKDWSGQHEYYLSHFFASVNNEFKAKTNWQVGFMDKATGKVTVFNCLENGFEIKPEDEVFKKDGDKVEELQMANVKVSIDQALEAFQEKLKEHFSSELLGDGFVIVQTFKGNSIWNFSFITKAMKFVNIKISTEDGKEVSHEVISLIQK